MALANYSDLLTSVASFIHRTDLSSEIPTFVQLAEAELNRRIRTREMEVRAYADAQQFVAMPSDFLELRNIQLNTTPLRSLVYMSPTDIDLHYGARTGIPEAFTFIADQFQFAPNPDAATYQVEIAYYQKIAALSETNTTNWLLTAHPDIYLAATMVQAGWFIQDDAMMMKWQGRLDAAINTLHAADRRARFGGPNMSVRPDISVA